jgi:hypothetical protein
VFDKKILDKVLLHRKRNQHIVANTYLHILNAHPNFLKNYSLPKKLKIWQSIKFGLVSLSRLFYSLFNHDYILQKENTKSEVLFVSHLINQNQLYKENDAYFGGLPNELEQYGLSSSIALIRHIKLNNWQPSRKWGKSKVQRFVLNLSLNFFSEIKLYLDQKKSKKQLRSILKDLQIEKSLAKDILLHHMSSSTFNALRIAKQVADIASRTGAKFVITTYEGYSWERLVYYYAKKHNPATKCFGYQHAAVFEHQYAIKQSLGEKYDPDYILTSGLFSQAIFNQLRSIKSSVVCLGSPRYDNKVVVASKTKCCLVVPEAMLDECLILFKFSLTYAKNHHEQRFIWRLHPLLSFEKLKKTNTIFKKIPDNIFLSEDDLDEDIKKSDSVLYRGSTAVVNAINAGLKPIYYQQSTDELSIDPIYQQQKGKDIVFNQKDLRLALTKDIDTEVKKSLQNFARDFYTPLDVQALKQVML